jgi:hypothetical protein
MKTTEKVYSEDAEIPEIYAADIILGESMERRACYLPNNSNKKF